MCDFCGQDFGANYPDSVCIDGYLWDADSGEASGDGWMYDHGGDIPCPACNEKEAVYAMAERLYGQADDKRPLIAFYPAARRRVRDYVQRMNDKWDPNQRWVPVEPSPSQEPKP
jgi:hypothetical protein